MNAVRTARLELREWREDDLEPFASLNADPETMRFFPSALTREESDSLAGRAQAQLAEQGWGLWAVEVTDSGQFIGFVGLAEPRFEAHFTPAVEVGWRLARDAWGYGYATEGGRAALAFAFGELGLEEVVSFTAVVNERSRKVMERLPMTHDPEDDFDHPSIAAGPLRRHVLYRTGPGLSSLP
jgi:RimJ/RimL family protein N-acetyltransferase